MKFEIDLNEIFDGENFNDSIRRQVVDSLINAAQKNLRKQIDDEVARAIQNTITESMKVMAPKLIDELLTVKYKPVDTYGRESNETCFKDEILKALQKEIVYRKENYSSNENHFTKAVNSIIESQVNGFKAEFKQKVDEAYFKETMAFAVNTLKTKLGLDK